MQHSDMARVKRVCPDDAVRQQLESETRDLVEQHWPAIEAVANVLFERRTLSMEEIIVAARDGTSARQTITPGQA